MPGSKSREAASKSLRLTNRNRRKQSREDRCGTLRAGGGEDEPEFFRAPIPFYCNYQPGCR